MTLTAKEKTFCQVYAVNGGDGTQAAIAAGFPAEAANAEAARMLTEKDISDYIAILKPKTEITTVIHRQIFSKEFSKWKKSRQRGGDPFVDNEFTSR